MDKPKNQPRITEGGVRVTRGMRHFPSVRDTKAKAEASQKAQDSTAPRSGSDSDNQNPSE